MTSPFEEVSTRLLEVRRDAAIRHGCTVDLELHITVTQEFRMRCLKDPQVVQYMESMRMGYRESKIMGVPFTVVTDESQKEPFRVWRAA